MSQLTRAALEAGFACGYTEGVAAVEGGYVDDAAREAGKWMKGEYVQAFLHAAEITSPRIPARHQLSPALQQASDDELQALAELGQWLARHENLLALGRPNGIRFGVTRSVSDFMLQSLGQAAGGAVGNMVILPD